MNVTNHRHSRISSTLFPQALPRKRPPSVLPPQVVLVTDMKQHFNTVKTFTDKVVPLAAGVTASALAAVQRGKGKASTKSALMPTLVSHRSLDSTSSRPSPGGSRPSPSGADFTSNLTRTRSIDTLASATATAAAARQPRRSSNLMLPTLPSSNVDPASDQAALTEMAAAAAAARHHRLSPAAAAVATKAAALTGASAAGGSANASSCELPHLSLEDEHCLLLWKVRGRCIPLIMPHTGRRAALEL